MLETIAIHSVEVAALCRPYGVARLDVFGSAANGTFDPAKSDIDFIVQFKAHAKAKAFDNFFGLREGFEAIFGHPIDLLTVEQIRNPYLAASIETSRRPVYIE